MSPGHSTRCGVDCALAQRCQRGEMACVNQTLASSKRTDCSEWRTRPSRDSSLRSSTPRRSASTTTSATTVRPPGPRLGVTAGAVRTPCGSARGAPGSPRGGTQAAATDCMLMNYHLEAGFSGVRRELDAAGSRFRGPAGRSRRCCVAPIPPRRSARSALSSRMIRCRVVQQMSGVPCVRAGVVLPACSPPDMMPPPPPPPPPPPGAPPPPNRPAGPFQGISDATRIPRR
jgi:hypothetical protein